MKIEITKKEMQNALALWENVKRVDYSKDTQEQLKSVEKTFNTLIVEENINSVVLEVPEEEIAKILRCSNFIMEASMDSAKDLASAVRGISFEWKEVMVKILGSVVKTLLLGSRFTRNLYNSICYYIASLKDAYDRAKTIDFNKLEDEIESRDLSPEELEEQWGTL